MADKRIEELRRKLRELFQLRYQGSCDARALRLQGFVDGYMAALLSSGVMTRGEMLTLVAQERAAQGGPALAPARAEALAPAV